MKSITAKENIDGKNKESADVRIKTPEEKECQTLGTGAKSGPWLPFYQM